MFFPHCEIPRFTPIQNKGQTYSLAHFHCCILSYQTRRQKLPDGMAVGKGKGKGKAIPVQAWTGPEGSRRLRLPDFKTVGT
jgi:hypothetical protein